MATRIWNHLTNWLEAYFWVPIALFFVWATIELHYFMTGRPTGEDSWEWVVGFGPQFAKAILAVVVVSISKEAFGSWLDKDQKLANPMFASVSAVCSTATFISLLYFWSR